MYRIGGRETKPGCLPISPHLKLPESAKRHIDLQNGRLKSVFFYRGEVDDGNNIGWTNGSVIYSDQQLDECIGVTELRVLTHQVTRTQVHDSLNIDIVDDCGANLDSAAEALPESDPHQLAGLIFG